MLSHVPGGAGVFEATMFTLLSGELGGAGRAALSAALIVYRLVYYLAPLAVAVAVAALAEARRADAASVALGRAGACVPSPTNRRRRPPSTG